MRPGLDCYWLQGADYQKPLLCCVTALKAGIHAGIQKILWGRQLVVATLALNGEGLRTLCKANTSTICHQRLSRCKQCCLVHPLYKHGPFDHKTVGYSTLLALSNECSDEILWFQMTTDAPTNTMSRKPHCRDSDKKCNKNNKKHSSKDTVQ